MVGKHPPQVPRLRIFTKIDIKPFESWTVGELESAKWNSKRLNLIQSHVKEDEFKKIATRESTKEVWKIFV